MSVSAGKVSILIPVYNREDYIGPCIESALSQTYPNLEVIISDNASTDRTWQVVQQYVAQDSRVKAVQNESNLGPVRNWKVAVDLATGAYGKILWSDDLISSNYIESCLVMLCEQTAVSYTHLTLPTIA